MEKQKRDLLMELLEEKERELDRRWIQWSLYQSNEELNLGIEDTFEEEVDRWLEKAYEEGWLALNYEDYEMRIHNLTELGYDFEDIQEEIDSEEENNDENFFWAMQEELKEYYKGEEIKWKNLLKYF